MTFDEEMKKFHRYLPPTWFFQVERHDAICILPLNVVNEKIYIFLWFWFIVLAILTAITLFYRVVIIFSPRMRVYLLRLRFR